MNKRHLLRRGIPLLLASTLLFTCACENRDINRVFMNETEKYIDAHENPFFWDDANRLSDYENLYELTPLGFLNKPYNYITKLGDHILIVGEGYTDPSQIGESIRDELNLDFDQFIENDSDAAEYKINYYFTVYDPWMNETIQTIPPELNNCDFYWVAGNHLFIQNYDRDTFAVYNERLELENTYPLDNFSKQCSAELFGIDNSNIYYTTTFDNELVRVTLANNMLTYEILDLPYKCIDIEGITPDQRQLVISAVDMTTMGYITCSLDYETLAEGFSFPNGGLFNGGVFNDGFITTQSSSDSTFNLSNSTGISYFKTDDFNSIHAVGEDSFLIEQIAEDENGEYSLYNFSLYDSKGNAISSITYDGSEKKNKDREYISYSSVYLESCNCIFLLVFDVSCHPRFLVWNLNEACDKQADIVMYHDYDDIIKEYALNPCPYIENYGYQITALENEDSYDWGPLSDLHARAEELADSYGIEIYIGPEVPEQIDAYHTDQCLEQDSIATALDRLEKIFSLYPKNFFQQLNYGSLRGIRIYLTDDIYANVDDVLADPSGFVNTIHDYNVMVLDVTYSWDWNYVVHHELSHMIDRRLEFQSLYDPDCLYSEDSWSALNPSYFSYYSSYSDYEGNSAYRNASSYFIDAYGSTFATEDRAEIFGTVMKNVSLGQSSGDDIRFQDGKALNKKINFYADCINASFDTTDWPEALPWDLYQN